MHNPDEPVASGHDMIVGREGVDVGDENDAVAPQPLAAVLSVSHLPVDVRHNSKVDRTRLGRWAGKVLEGGSAPRRV